MRSEQEMFRLILGVAENEERIRAVYLNGSRANPNAPKDVFQDYDIVYVVRDFASFTAQQDWISVFGSRLLLQMPEAMRFPSGAGHFNWMMLFTDGNRLDLTLIPIERPELIGRDSLTLALLDKDGILPPFPAASDRDYVVTRPAELFYSSCCNDFWWCLQNVAKGIARCELPYAMMMYHTVVREGLHEMISWYIGCTTDFSVSTGKMGKYFGKYLPPALYKQYLRTYSDCDCNRFWGAILTACGLFSTLAAHVAHHLGYEYRAEEERGLRAYLALVQQNSGLPM